MAMERITAFNQRGEKLVGLLHLPDALSGALQSEMAGPPLIVSCPGLMSSKDGTKHVALGAAAEARGVALLRVDYSGIGESEGAFAGSILSQRVEDTLALLRAACAPTDFGVRIGSRIAFVGSSFGAPTALLCAAQLHHEDQQRQSNAAAGSSAASAISSPAPNKVSNAVTSTVTSLVTWAATCDFAAALAVSDPRALAAFRRGESYERREEGRVYSMTPAFLDDFARYDFADCLASLGDVPTLFVHGKRDEVVPYQQSEQLHAWAKDPKRLVLFDDATHGLHEVMPALLDLTLDWPREACGRG